MLAAGDYSWHTNVPHLFIITNVCVLHMKYVVKYINKIKVRLKKPEKNESKINNYGAQCSEKNNFCCLA